MDNFEKCKKMLSALYPNGKTLYLREMGMNDNSIPGDIHNHRIRVIERIDIAYKHKVYRKFFFEFTSCKRYKYRKLNKITGKPLKHEIREIENVNGIGIDTEFDQEEYDGRMIYNASYRLSKMESELWNENFSYTRADILRIINRFAIEKYNNLVLVEEETRRIINNIGGYREKEILNNDSYMEIGETWNNDHKIMRVVERVKTETRPGCYTYTKGRSCEIDIVTGKITN